MPSRTKLKMDKSYVLNYSQEVAELDKIVKMGVQVRWRGGRLFREGQHKYHT